ncbi:MAG: hypothetical protein HC886_22530 [Leptolyngbyaceae cyanobacterium SM1_1_3]|nr:hypothetical protein [Leptolyngbyaceae cyanobacterium SM1_1_3]NJM85560.1 hypothetical protein [Leptolyngbyaceae cyanobacterium RM2_2_21]NJN03824.1 hypothetical protein [Leptolyngbyaceae cyanobacterium RM1_1_2]NJO08640.1 hypothetical protein [Leptolyngbyaceae cyanobacterium SL_1_1]
MSVNKICYESLLADCSSYQGAIELLKQYRPYLETLPSIRRPAESILSIPLPTARIRQAALPQRPDDFHSTIDGVQQLPCDIVLLMCDPEWKIKTGVEICLFIHRPHEDFSDLLGRWRQTQILLDKGYEWLLPLKYKYLLSEGADTPHPLFVVFPETPARILKGLKGAALPVICHASSRLTEADMPIPATSDAGEAAVEVIDKTELKTIDVPEDFDEAS